MDDFEFYDDRGGLTKSREAEMKSMTSFCGEQRQRQKLRRELIRESVEVSPIKDFVVVETGRHRTKELPLPISSKVNLNSQSETVDHVKPWWKFWK